MARPFGLAKKMRAALSVKEMTHGELCAAFPQHSPRQISQAINQQSRALPGIRSDGGSPKKYRPTKVQSRQQFNTSVSISA